MLPHIFNFFSIFFIRLYSNNFFIRNPMIFKNSLYCTFCNSLVFKFLLDYFGSLLKRKDGESFVLELIKNILGHFCRNWWVLYVVDVRNYLCQPKCFYLSGIFWDYVSVGLQGMDSFSHRKIWVLHHNAEILQISYLPLFVR